MPGLNSREEEIIKAIHRNHRDQLQSKMLTHFGVYFKYSEPPARIYSWIEKIDDIRLLTNTYLDTLVKNQKPASEKSLEQETTGFAFFWQKAKSLIPESITHFFSNQGFGAQSYRFFSFASTEIFSLALGHSITDVLFDYFKTQFVGSQEEAQKQFAELLEKQTELSHLIKKECKRISIELIKLFHFREMLLLGKMSNTATEPNVRNELIYRANLSRQSTATINTAIEVYFAQELSNIFNHGFRSLYHVKDVEIQSEMNFPFIKWINQLSESEKVRSAFTQEIQLKFMLLSRDFLLEQMNEPAFLARHAKVYSLMAGLIVAAAITVALVLILGSGFLGMILAASAACLTLTGIVTYFLINKVEALTYVRKPDNRTQLQYAITLINDEFLRLKKEVVEKKETTHEAIHDTRDFEQINQKFLHVRNIARGSISGWLREYASRYRHSKAVEIDLGDEYKQLIVQSRTQTRNMIDSINKKELHSLKSWVLDTQNYLNNPRHSDVIKNFELIPKIKEQILKIVSHISYIPPLLLTFYCSPQSRGGLGGNESDFAHIRRFTPTYTTENSSSNPYHFLCDVALNLFKRFEPLHASNLIFLGDPEYRQMLGISRADYGIPVDEDNIGTYLKNSCAFLLSLCRKVAPGHGLDPLQQPAQLNDEFILYRMLLLKQLATLASNENKETNAEVKLKIRQFIHCYFNQDTKTLFDNLANQFFLLNKNVQKSQTYKNTDQFPVLEAELANIMQAITLDMVYNSIPFKLNDVLNYYIDDFLKQQTSDLKAIFAYKGDENELNPQGTQHFIDIISNYCSNTAAFMISAQKNRALTATNILQCYQYNVSLQVYKTQLRIIKNMKEIYKLEETNERVLLINHLSQAFKELYKFAKTHCISLKTNSPCTQLFQLVSTKKIKSGKDNEWIKTVDSTETLIYMMNNIDQQVQLPVPAAPYKSGLFQDRRIKKGEDKVEIEFINRW